MRIHHLSNIPGKHARMYSAYCSEFELLLEITLSLQFFSFYKPLNSEEKEHDRRSEQWILSHSQEMFDEEKNTMNYKFGDACISCCATRSNVMCTTSSKGYELVQAGTSLIVVAKKGETNDCALLLIALQR